MRAGGFDVVHLHEPVAPVIGWDALTLPHRRTRWWGRSTATPRARRRTGSPTWWAPDASSTTCPARIAVSEAAAWTGRRFYGGRYRIVPNGVEAPRRPVFPGQEERAPGEPLRIAFVGQAVARKGLPVLLRAFEALRRRVPAELEVVGAASEELAPLLMDGEGVTALGRVGEADQRSALRLGRRAVRAVAGRGAFGMVLTEAFAAGTPVVASDIAGYRDVVTDGADGLLVPRGDATRAR